jgi:3-methyl-2-oxobutanoate hydroxymethyltransferase
VTIAAVGAFPLVLDGSRGEPRARAHRRGGGADDRDRRLTPCDGQILAIDDMLGLVTEFTLKFVMRYHRLGDEIRAAAREYAEEVRQGRFPPKHTYSAPR